MQFSTSFPKAQGPVEAGRRQHLDISHTHQGQRHTVILVIASSFSIHRGSEKVLRRRFEAKLTRHKIILEGPGSFKLLWQSRKVIRPRITCPPNPA